MTRVLMIDGNRALTDSVGLKCVEQGMAVRMTSAFCDGLRLLTETPVSLIVVSSDLLTMPAGELAKLFDVVAPDVPVVIRLTPGRTMDEQVTFELHGFRVVREPFDVQDLVVKGERPPRRAASTDAAARLAVEAACR
jgi:DNA-binding response OmpR family regulator